LKRGPEAPHDAWGSAMIEMTEPEMEQMLQASRLGRLCMADRQGRPYAIPLPFCWLDGTLYLRLPMTGRKGQILCENDQVCFELDSCSDTLDEYASILIEGRLATVNDLAEKARVQGQNSAKYQRLRLGYRPGHGRSKPLEEIPMQKIVVRQISGRCKTRDGVKIK
jgi:nitroimidazol reductase NimA-like FMN-containing flavoprotein (pyridoxamine 5'-phosphate oxidase superfamily)